MAGRRETKYLKLETLKWAYRDAKENNGAPGIDGVTSKEGDTQGR